MVAVLQHQMCISKLQKRNYLVDFLSIAVPVFYIFPRFLIKGVEWEILGFVLEDIVNTTGEILSALLLVMVIFKLVYRWQDSEVQHWAMITKNRSISLEANQLLTNRRTSGDVVEQFLRRVSEIDTDDDKLLISITKKQEQQTYREALKKLDGEAARCRVCGANPWRFKEGDCDACGGSLWNRYH